MTRRGFLQLAGAAGVIGADVAASEGFLDPWTPGTLDIHHLSYGRGNSTFLLCPDGTTMLIDAGATEDPPSLRCAQKPDASIRAGDWIASYISRQMRVAARTELDFAIVTHIHPDHINGMRDVDTRVPIRKLVDRGYPGYDNPPPLDLPFTRNYLEFVKMRTARGDSTERVIAGSSHQIHLVREQREFPEFVVRNLAANGEVWTGQGESARHCFPLLKDLPKADYPNENMCSVALRISYGKFDYFTGGDLTSDTEESRESWRDIETPVARAAGPVEVAVANHHGYFDAVGANFVRALRPRIFIIPAWYVAHPDILPLRRMLSQQLFAGARDVYATCLAEANRAVNIQYVPQLKSSEGHIIVRVAPGGEEFRVVVTDNAADVNRPKSINGPYRCN